MKVYGTRKVPQQVVRKVGGGSKQEHRSTFKYPHNSRTIVNHTDLQTFWVPNGWFINVLFFDMIKHPPFLPLPLPPFLLVFFPAFSSPFFSSFSFSFFSFSHFSSLFFYSFFSLSSSSFPSHPLPPPNPPPPTHAKVTTMKSSQFHISRR